MEYDKDKKEIILNKELSELDKLVLKFLEIIKKHAKYVIISGYISILLGRSRATEDIDLFLEKINKNRFMNLYNDLIENNFWCLNTSNTEEAFDFLDSGLAVRFAVKDTAIPNFEVKFPKRKIDEGTFEDFIDVQTPEGKIRISSLERQIAFKRYYLGSDKDEEDALHIEEIFKEDIDFDKINKFRGIIEKIKKDET